MNKHEILLVGSVASWVGACWFGVCVFMMGWGLEDLVGSSQPAISPRESTPISSAHDARKPDAIALVLRHGLDP